MNITLSADQALVTKAREAAHRRGVSLNHFIREEMQRLTETGGADAADEFLTLIRTRAGRSPKGYRFNRGEAHAR